MRASVLHILTVLMATAAIALAAAAPARAAAAAPSAPAGSFAKVVRQVQPKIVKLYGAGGVRGLEPYQSGFLISAEGHILTVWSYVLDSDSVIATLDDGARHEAKLLGADPRMELAVLKIEGAALPHFDLVSAGKAPVGTRILALSNLFGVAAGDEAASVQHGLIAAEAQLDARRGVFATPYRGPIYVLDAVTNNPGAAGGALVDQKGQLLGMLGKELRSAATGAWLNYAIPIEQLAPTTSQIIAGRFSPPPDGKKTVVDDPLDLNELGLVLVPEVLDRTPPFVEAVRSGSPALAAGVHPDDLVLFVGDHLVQSNRALREELARIEQGSEVKLVLMRGQDMVDVTLKSAPRAAKP